MKFFIIKVIDDEHLEVANPEEIHFDKVTADFLFVPKIDQSEVFDKAWKVLRDGKCFGIFPEGGSHDRVDLLPLKAGACIMSLGATVKYNVDCKIITCGMNYFKVNIVRDSWARL